MLQLFDGEMLESIGGVAVELGGGSPVAGRESFA